MRYCGDDHEPGNEPALTKKDIKYILITLVIGFSGLIALGYVIVRSYQ